MVLSLLNAFYWILLIAGVGTLQKIGSFVLRKIGIIESKRKYSQEPLQFNRTT